VQLITNENQQLKELLQSAEFAATLEEEDKHNSEYYLNRDMNERLTMEDVEDEPSDAGEGSASDSDDE